MNKKSTTIVTLLAITGCIAITFSSCSKKDPNSPGVEFMPDMYRSPSVESNMTYVDLKTGDTMVSNRLPVEGTIARGYYPYAFPNTEAGYNDAKVNSHNPLAHNDMIVKQGEELYGKYCIHCHGATGQGDGLVGGKLPGPPPPYTAPDKINLTEGELFQIITYGKGLMGAHAPMLTQEERWKLVEYVQHLQHPDGMPAAPSDSTKTKKN